MNPNQPQMPNQSNETWQTEPEAPLEGLIKKPINEMTVEELRQQVSMLSTLRKSSQALQKMFRGQKEDEKLTPTSTVFDQF
jgi:hypothetical protein